VEEQRVRPEQLSVEQGFSQLTVFWVLQESIGLCGLVPKTA
jgi:hypothetical protein